MNKLVEENRAALKKQVETLLKLQNEDEKKLAGFELEALSNADRDSLKMWL